MDQVDDGPSTSGTNEHNLDETKAVPIECDEDEALLLRMGYKQDLYRGFDGFMSIAFCFTAVAVVSSITGLLTNALKTGGPVVLIWSWIVCAILTIIVSLNLAEICSTYPSAGSVYYWAGALAPDASSSILAYITGWFNFMGNAAADAFWAYTFAAQVDGLMQLYGYAPLTPDSQVIMGLGVLGVWALMNLLRVDSQGWINNFAGILQLATALAIIVTLAFTCSTADYTYNIDYASLSYNSTVEGTASVYQVFTTFYNQTGNPNVTYVVLIGLLTSLYTFTGYEAAAHMSEETRDASKTAPWGIVNTSLLTAATGFGVILSLLFATANQLDNIYYNNLSIIGIFEQCSGISGAAGLGFVLTATMFLNGFSSYTVTTRITFAMARDGAFPASSYIAYVARSSAAPVGAVILIFLFDSILILLNLINSTAFVAVTSVSTIGYQISYAIPIILRVTSSRNSFPLGRFNLGRYGPHLGAVSSVFLVFTSLLFILPTEFPVTFENMNYTSVVVVGVMAISLASWQLHARFYFIAPHKRAEPGELARLASLHTWPLLRQA